MSRPIDRNALIALVGLSAGMLAGCGPSDAGQWRVCTDDRGRRVADADCAPGSTGGGHGFGGSGGGGWRYLSREGAAPAIGDEVSGGTRAPSGGTAEAAPAEGITRGGFGGMGEGGEGGHGGAGE
ncbi:MAG TPA: hypothetical protein VFF98_01600 [Novosphingobium sp.]|nr:hypothetical protein [Novosphingobium sp.]